MTSVSILISNYNYAHFLPHAINSALDQTYADTEVVVVDDGSTDNSRDIIAAYGHRITAVYKENGGLASAINTGFAASRGDVVCLLDADDAFLGEKLMRVLAAFRSVPDATVVYHQVLAIDAQNKPIGRLWPRAVWRGNIRRLVERSGGWWPYPTASGLAFRRTFLERLLPIPSPNRHVNPDTYLAGPAAFAGPVVGLSAPLALVRLHGANMSTAWRRAESDDAKRTREKRRRGRDQCVDEFQQLQSSLARLSISAPALSLDDHLPFQRYRRAVGERVSLVRLLTLAVCCPALPVSMRVTEVARILLNRW